jgi:sugar-specific transcriptional regulator TrmB
VAFQDEEVQTLTCLGLTLCQARVYLALARSGMSTAKTISKVSKVTREDIYRIMPTLQKLGLVEKVITKPAKFKATSIQDAVSILLEHRTKEHSELHAKTKKLLQNFKENNAKTTILEEEPQFVLIPKKEALHQRRMKATQNAQTSIDVVTSWKRFQRAMISYAETLKKAVERGVKIRVVLEKPEGKNSLPEAIQASKKNPSVIVRCIPAHPTAVVMVYDRKEVFIITSPTARLTESPALWSNNPSLVELAQNYFETLWFTSVKDKHEELRRRAVKAFQAAGVSEYSPTNATWADLSSMDHQKIWAVDFINYSKSVSVNLQYPMMLFRFKVASEAQTVQKIILSFVGCGTAPDGNGITIKVWNHVASAWQNAASGSDGAKEIVSITLTSNLTNYIDSNGYIWFLARTTNPSNESTAAVINCDHVSCTVTIDGITYLVLSTATM